MLKTKQRAKKPFIEDTTLYPDSDGKPMAETGIHVMAIMLAHQALEDFFELYKRKVWVASNIFWYYETGNFKARISPDTMVILDADVGKRSFYSWEQPQTRPDIIFEFTSEKTKREDLVKKKVLYEKLGVPEYIMFDPRDSYLDPPLIGYELVDGDYQLKIMDCGVIPSRLGFNLISGGDRLIFIDRLTAEPILSRREKNQQSEKLARESIERADKLEREIARLRLEINRLRQARTNGHKNGQ